MSKTKIDKTKIQKHLPNSSVTELEDGFKVHTSKIDLLELIQLSSKLIDTIESGFIKRSGDGVTLTIKNKVQ